MSGVAERHAETALLCFVKALVQRLLGVGQAFQGGCPGRQRIRAFAQSLGFLASLLSGSVPCMALCDPLLADLSDRLLDRGPVLLLIRRQLQRGLEPCDACIGKRAEVIGCETRTL